MTDQTPLDEGDVKVVARAIMPPVVIGDDVWSAIPYRLAEHRARAALLALAEKYTLLPKGETVSLDELRRTHGPQVDAWLEQLPSAPRAETRMLAAIEAACRDLAEYERVHDLLDEGAQFDEIDLEWNGDRPSYAYWNAYFTQRIINDLKQVKLIHEHHRLSSLPSALGAETKGEVTPAQLGEAMHDWISLGEPGQTAPMSRRICIDVMERILDGYRVVSSLPAPDEGWRDISTAPKDGTPFLAINEHQAMLIVCARQEALEGGPGEWFYVDHFTDCSELDSPTHWRPLPPPPSAVAAGEEGDDK